MDLVTLCKACHNTRAFTNMVPHSWKEIKGPTAATTEPPAESMNIPARASLKKQTNKKTDIRIPNWTRDHTGIGPQTPGNMFYSSAPSHTPVRSSCSYSRKHGHSTCPKESRLQKSSGTPKRTCCRQPNPSLPSSQMSGTIVECRRRRRRTRERHYD